MGLTRINFKPAQEAGFSFLPPELLVIKEEVMKRVAIFGNAGGGKSTLAKQLALAHKLPLHSLDKIKYKASGEEIPQTEYLQLHSELIKRDKWIIDGFGCLKSAWARFDSADTLIYIDLPLYKHGAWVTKRLLKGGFIKPEGWPENSSILKGSLNSYKVLWLCHKKLTPAYRELVSNAQKTKQVFHLKSPADIKKFIIQIQKEKSDK